MYFLNALAFHPSTINVDAAGITVEMAALVSVSAGQNFNLTVNNSNDQPIQLNSLVFDAKIMDGVTVQGSDPAFLKVTPFKLNGDFIRYDFHHAIPANGSLVIQVALTGLNPGSYQR